MIRRALTPRKAAPYVLIAPALLILLVFNVIPIFYSIWLALIKYNVVMPDKSQFVGLDNFAKLFRDEFLWRNTGNTFIYAVGTLVPGLVLSFIFALLICEPWFRFQGTTRSLLFIPSIISIAICGLIWSYIFQPDFGILNRILLFLHLPEQKLLGQPKYAMWAVNIMVIWRDLGYRITFWSAGILSISSEYTEAAHIDGATWFQELIYVRLPLLRPILVFLSVLGVIGSFQAFDAIYALTSGGPAGSTEVLVFYIWKVAFGQNNLGYASAIAWFMFIFLIFFTILQMRIFQSDSEEIY